MKELSIKKRTKIAWKYLKDILERILNEWKDPERVKNDPNFIFLFAYYFYIKKALKQTHCFRLL